MHTSILPFLSAAVTWPGAIAPAAHAPGPSTPDPRQQAQAPAAAEPVVVGEEPLRWIDPLDGGFDVSDFLEHPAGFLPLVVPITEPALGYGAVIAAAFLDPREEAGHEGWARPNMTFVGGMLTEDGSDGLFAANSSLWDDGDLQTLVGVGSLGLELDYYGLGQDAALDGTPLGYRLGVQGVVAEVRRRLGDSDFWGGVRFAYARTEADFDADPGSAPGVDAGVGDVTLAGPAVTVRYDSLDNAFTPTRGALSETSASFFDDTFGGSRDFQVLQQILIGHVPLGGDFFLGARTQFTASFGDTPFYSRPYIDLRGVPALRYQGDEVLTGEAELRWQFEPRWSAVGFGGAGVAWSEVAGVDRDQDAWAGGFGFRYLVARVFGLHVGLDVAWGPEDTAIYVQFGNPWFRP